MDGSSSSNTAEAVRSLAIAEKLLLARDLVGSKKFALKAQESDPLLDGSDQILAIADVLLAAEKRINNHMDWYAILQVNPKSDGLDSIRKQYRTLALLLHPEKNKAFGADSAFKLVLDAWFVLSDPLKRSLYDKELNMVSNLNLSNSKSRVSWRKTTSFDTPRVSNFWTGCPYCYNMYEYVRVYENCDLRCQNCRRAFRAIAMGSHPLIPPGSDGYYCSWGFLPLGFSNVPNPNPGFGYGAGAPFVPNSTTGVGFKEGSMNVDLNVELPNEFESGKKVKNSNSNDGAYSVPIIGKSQKKVKKVARKPRKQTGRMGNKIKDLGKGQSGFDSAILVSSPENVENVEPETETRNTVMGGGRETEDIGFFEGLEDFQIPVEGVGEMSSVELRNYGIDMDPSDIPGGLLKISDVKDEEIEVI